MDPLNSLACLYPGKITHLQHFSFITFYIVVVSLHTFLTPCRITCSVGTGMVIVAAFYKQSYRMLHKL